jgi:YHS domain-containing protein
MAAQIRAKQLDIPNRVKACQYLGTVDCVTYPEAQDMLIATMKEDPAEVVRYEAVMALRNMLTRGCCNMDSLCECPSCCNRKKIARQTEAHARKGCKALIKEAKGPAKKAAKKAERLKEAEDERYDCCRGCSNEKVMKALAEVASKKDDQCCWVEPSERVRTAAEEAMCLFPNYANGYMLPDTGPEPVPSADEEAEEREEKAVPPQKIKEAIPDSGKEATPPDAAAPAPANSDARKSSRTISTASVTRSQAAAPSTIPNVPAVNSVPHPISASAVPNVPVLKDEPVPLSLPIVPGLRGRCIVALKSRQILPCDSRFSSLYEERTYFFSSADAKDAFDQNPRFYAPAYGGLDPVAWLQERQMIDGQILREYNGQFFLFTSKENWELFQLNPQRYVLKDNNTNVRTVSSQN